MAKSLYWLLWLSGIVFVAAFLFTEGFLLARLELQENNTRTQSVAQYDRVVLIIIDALRFDFVYFNTSLNDNMDSSSRGGSSSSSRDYYHNKMRIVHELIEKQPSQARLFKFLADPPTVTMQRLKGLTTGGLPTFIDVKDNFASSAILEDNLLGQLNRKKKKIVMMGDDTWLSIFPNEFFEAFPFPSFNVKDLHTVDNGVLAHLLPSILSASSSSSVTAASVPNSSTQMHHESHRTSNSDSSPRIPTTTTKKGSGSWDFLIAHFLGVDHVGHRYGPLNEWMEKKLMQMSAVIAHVVQAIDPLCFLNSTVLPPIPTFDNSETQDSNAAMSTTAATLATATTITSDADAATTTAPITTATAATASTSNHPDTAVFETEISASSSHLSAATNTFSSLNNNNNNNNNQRTLLLVMGDHGMTQQGEHGGATNEETGAGLFVYSTYPIFSRDLPVPSRQHLNRAKLWSGEEYATIPQIDLVPSLSLLLGLPIPYGNLGSLIPELLMGPQHPSASSIVSSSSAFTASTASTSLASLRLSSYQNLLNALHENAQQVWQYLSSYSKLSSTFGDSISSLATEWESAKNAFDKQNFEQEQGILNTINQFQVFLSHSSAMCREKWTQFDLTSMGFAITLLIVGLVFFIVAELGCLPGTVFNQGAKGALCGGVVTVVIRCMIGMRLSFMLGCVALCSIAGGLTEPQAWKKASILPGKFTLDNTCPLLCWVIYMQGLFSNSFIVAEHNVAVFLASTVWLTSMISDSNKSSGRNTVLHVLVGVFARVLGKGSNFSPDANFLTLSFVECGLCISSLLFLVVAFIVCCCRCPSKTTTTSFALIVRGSMFSISVLQMFAAIGFWSGSGRLLLPRFVYVTSLAGLCCVYTSIWKRKLNGNNHEVCMYNFALWTGPLVLLLGPYAPLLVGTLVAMTMCMCLSSSSSPSDVVIIDSSTNIQANSSSNSSSSSSAAAHSSATVKTDNNIKSASVVSFSETTFLYFVIVALFYATGHRLGFESIPASCAFVGFDDFNLYLGGLFVILHCFSGHIFGLFSLSILISYRSRSKSSDSGSSSIKLLSFCFTLRLLLTMVNVTVQRRHLMVWAIFAPKFIFDCLTGVCVQCLLILVQILVS